MKELQADFLERINKYIYEYDPKREIVSNRVVKTPAFTSDSVSYEKLYDRGNSSERIQHFLREDIEGKTILDFGCAEGGVLLACLEQGAKKGVGVDHNPFAIAMAVEKAKKRSLNNAEFLTGDMENKAFLSKLQPADTVLLLAILSTSEFTSQGSVIASVSRFAKRALYYEGHVSPESRVRPFYELLLFTDFTRFEYLGRFDWRILIRCGREIYTPAQVPENAVTSEDGEQDQLNAEEIYVFPDTDRNPSFSRKCRLIQFVQRS